MKKEN